MRKKMLIGIFLLIIVGLLTGGILVWNKVWVPTRMFAAEYPMKGVDVSSYQGKIDWAVLAGQGICFAFIKATEGSSFVDPCFWRIMNKHGKQIFE